MCTIVHLVHGTWAYGIFGRGRREAATMWIGDGSPFRAQMAASIDTSVEFREFHWSGKNSFKARASATARLQAHLRKSIHDAPQAVHIVIAHSHGATIAMHALAGMENRDDANSPIRHAIFLAAPFTYLTPRRSHTFTNALACLLVGMTLGNVSAKLLPAEAGLGTTVLLDTLLGAALFIPFSIGINILLGLRPEPGLGYCMDGSIPAYIDVTVLRGTRDEAALAIGLAQTLKFIGDTFISLGSKENGVWHSVFIAFNVLVSIIFSVATSFLLIGLIGILPSILYTAVLGSTAFLPAGRYDIDVDAAPPGRPVVFRSFPQLTLSSMRHSLYDDPSVQDEIVEIIQRNIRAYHHPA